MAQDKTNQDELAGNDVNKVEQEYAVLGEGEGPAWTNPIPYKRLIALIAGPVVAIVLMLWPAPEGMKPEAWSLVALAAWMVIWWLGEAVPIPATALLPIPLMPLLGMLRRWDGSYALKQVVIKKG